jgi:hypothetical protein
MFYFTGDKFVPDIETNYYLPGAMADHLTSSGGKLVNNVRQMSAMRWLEAGVTGSYGTVVEPCAFLQKFPNPVLAIGKYLQGETLIEAYWKSVQMPGQGVFIGEPLANPYRGYGLRVDSGSLVLQTFLLEPAAYRLFRADRPSGPYHLLKEDRLIPGRIQSFQLPAPYSQFYKIERQ